jgi:hypothetical protein
VTWAKVAAKLGVSVYLVKKAIRQANGLPVGPWKKQRRVGYLWTLRAINWATSKATLQQQVGFSRRARCLQFCARYPNQTPMTVARLARLYRQYHVRPQMLRNRLGRPILGPVERQLRELAAARDAYAFARQEGRIVVQIDEAAWTAKKLGRLHYAPPGGLEMKSRWASVAKINCLAAICEEAGLLAVDYKDDKFLQGDICAFLLKIRLKFNQREKVCIYMDGAPVHTAHSVARQMRLLDFTYIVGPAARPDLNGIEMLFRRGKAYYYRQMDNNRARGLNWWDNWALVKNIMESTPQSMCRRIARQGRERLERSAPVSNLQYSWEDSNPANMVNPDPDHRNVAKPIPASYAEGKAWADAEDAAE